MFTNCCCSFYASPRIRARQLNVFVSKKMVVVCVKIYIVCHFRHWKAEAGHGLAQKSAQSYANHPPKVSYSIVYTAEVRRDDNFPNQGCEVGLIVTTRSTRHRKSISALTIVNEHFKICGSSFADFTLLATCTAVLPARKHRPFVRQATPTILVALMYNSKDRRICSPCRAGWNASKSCRHHREYCRCIIERGPWRASCKTPRNRVVCMYTR